MTGDRVSLSNEILSHGSNIYEYRFCERLRRRRRTSKVFSSPFVLSLEIVAGEARLPLLKSLSIRDKLLLFEVNLERGVLQRKKRV